MSMEAKQALIQSVEELLSDELTVSSMRRVEDALRNGLLNYHVEEISTNANEAGPDDMIAAFISAKKVEGRSSKTLKRYEYILNKLVAHAGVPIGKIHVGHIRAYFAEEKDRGIKDRTLEGERNVFCSCFGWLYKEEMIKKNPCVNLNAIKYAKKVRLPYSSTDIELMKEACMGIRDKAIICFLLSTGARISEVCALNQSDIDFRQMECTVLGKGNKERTVYLDTVAAMLLKRYLAWRKDQSTALFTGKGSTRLTPGGVRKILKAIEKRSGVENVHPHRFRRTLATGLINHGMPIQEVAAILGHERIDTTMEYVYTEKQNVKNSYRKCA